VERTIGILKRRFNCLQVDSNYEPEFVGRYVVACCILHNICFKLRDNLEDNDIMDINAEIDAEPFIGNENGTAARTAFILQHFR
jgi:hypothetical protein